jgi:hypothetical protein
MACSALSYTENPFCTECYDERVTATAPPEPVVWRLEGDYLIRADDTASVQCKTFACTLNLNVPRGRA